MILPYFGRCVRPDLERPYNVLAFSGRPEDSLTSFFRLKLIARVMDLGDFYPQRFRMADSQDLAGT